MDRTLDVCGVTSHATESVLDKIMAALPRFPGHANEVAVDMSPLCEANNNMYVLFKFLNGASEFLNFPKAAIKSLKLFAVPSDRVGARTVVIITRMQFELKLNSD